MYDNYISERKFRKFKSDISQLYYVTNDINVPELITDIQMAYCDGEISSTQYDNLIGELNSLGYTL